MGRPHPTVLKAAVAMAVAMFFLGLYRVAQSIRIRSSYESVEAVLLPDSRKVGLGGGPLNRGGNSHLLSYTFQIGSEKYSGHGKTHYEPIGGKAIVYYLRSDPRINTPENPDSSLLEGAYWLFGSMGFYFWLWPNRHSLTRAT